MAKLVNNNKVTTIADVMKNIKKEKDIQLGVEEVEFPDGMTFPMYYNGEDDRKAGIKFAQICLDASTTTGEIPDCKKAREYMRTCFWLLVKGYTIDEIVQTEDYGECYIDLTKKVLIAKTGDVLAELDEDDTTTDKTKIVIKLMEQLT